MIPKIAIVGAGYAANYYLKALPELGYEIVGITDLDRDKGLRVAKNSSIKFFNTYKDLLERSGLNMIFITTPTSNHLDSILTAVKSGIKWIYCEKPIASDITETKKIQSICEENEVMVGVGYKMRFESIFSKVKSMLDKNDIGELVYITMSFFQPIPDRVWFLDSGVIRETLIHIIDLTSWFAEKNPTSVFCDSKSYYGGLGEDRASIIIQYDAGIKASINGAYVHDYPTPPGKQSICFQIVGTGGYICGIRPDKLLLCIDSGREMIDLDSADPIKLEVLDFIKNVTSGKTPSVSVSDGIITQAIVDASLESAEKSCSIPVI